MQSWNFPLGVSGFRFADLNRVRRLIALDQTFREDLAKVDSKLAERLEEARSASNGDTELLIAVARHIDRFLAKLFHIEAVVETMNGLTLDDNTVFRCKKEFLDHRVLKPHPGPDELAEMKIPELEFAYREVVAEVLPGRDLTADPERELAEVVIRLLDDAPKANGAPADERSTRRERNLARITAWVRALAFHPNLAPRRQRFASFVLPEKLDYDALVPRVFGGTSLPMVFEGPLESRRFRDGFVLTDDRMTSREALREMHYCIICHPRDKDSCSNGLPEGSDRHKPNPLGIELTGCPLDEKISEAHLLKREGHGIGALAMIMVDNPLCAGTGHRICNDCMKSCIFQKQTPVNIPQIETSILSDVLHLPYGFEIYSLLCPLEPAQSPPALSAALQRQEHPRRRHGAGGLHAGPSPAQRRLRRRRHRRPAIEPLSVRMRGAKRRVPQPIKDIKDITGPLDRRTILGFGGVSEYGITVRWDKNFLDINYLLLMRRKKFRLYDGVRFGGTVTLDDAWKLGFDHVAICAGAGKPTLAEHEEQSCSAACGWRPISSWACRPPASIKDSLANLQLRPARGCHRRRPDRHRHGDGDAGLLRRAGGKNARPLRPPGRQDRRGGHLGNAG